jgi:hypothetical protein
LLYAFHDYYKIKSKIARLFPQIWNPNVVIIEAKK